MDINNTWSPTAAKIRIELEKSSDFWQVYISICDVFLPLTSSPYDSPTRYKGFCCHWDRKGHIVMSIVRSSNLSLLNHRFFTSLLAKFTISCLSKMYWLPFGYPTKCFSSIHSTKIVTIYPIKCLSTVIKQYGSLLVVQQTAVFWYMLQKKMSTV